MEDLSSLALLPLVQPSSAAFLAALLADAVGGAPAAAGAFSLPADAPGCGGAAALPALARVARALLVDALSRGAAEPTFSERLARAGVPPAACAALAAALFGGGGGGGGAAGAAAAARLSLPDALGTARLVDFDWAAKVTLASSGVGAGVGGAALALTLASRAPGGAVGATPLELSPAELDALIEELEAARDVAAAVRAGGAA